MDEQLQIKYDEAANRRRKHSQVVGTLLALTQEQKNALDATTTWGKFTILLDSYITEKYGGEDNTHEDGVQYTSLGLINYFLLITSSYFN